MKVSNVGNFALTVCLALTSFGCTYRRDQGIRRDTDGQTPPVISAASAEDVESTMVKSQHAGGRKPASLSDEAREIEGHFNVR